jgi:hypothetical protein
MPRAPIIVRRSSVHRMAVLAHAWPCREFTQAQLSTWALTPDYRPSIDGPYPHPPPDDTTGRGLPPHTYQYRRLEADGILTSRFVGIRKMWRAGPVTLAECDIINIPLTRGPGSKPVEPQTVTAPFLGI